MQIIEQRKLKCKLSYCFFIVCFVLLPPVVSVGEKIHVKSFCDDGEQAFYFLSIICQNREKMKGKEREGPIKNSLVRLTEVQFCGTLLKTSKICLFTRTLIHTSLWWCQRLNLRLYKPIALTSVSISSALSKFLNVFLLNLLIFKMA